MGIANGKYLLFDLKFMALQRVSVKAFWSIEAKSNSEECCSYPNLTIEKISQTIIDIDKVTW
jgi:hypothetical protein